LVVGLLILSLFSVGCQLGVKGGETPEETAGLVSFVRSGTQGLEVGLVRDLPPRTIYDVADLTAVAELKNKGAYDIESDKCFVELGGFDKSIIRNIFPGTRQSCGDIEGKSVFNEEGGFNQIEFQSSSLFLPQGVDKYSPNLVLSTCYNYKTIANPQICVDPNFYQLTSEQKSCQVRDVPLGGGQGAPVAVDFAGVDMLGSKAIIQLDISNAGGGRVVSPRTSLTQCPNALRYDNFDEVRFTVKLADKFPEKCTPSDNMVRLVDGRGKIFCTFNIGNVPAYETPLNIELNYNYLQSISKKIEIIKTPQ